MVEKLPLLYLHDSLRHSGLRHLKILSSSTWGMMVAKGQNGQLTKPGISACLISSSCIFLSKSENIFADRTTCKVAVTNSCWQSVKQGKLTRPWPMTSSADLRMHSLQKTWPSGQDSVSSNKTSSSKQQPHSTNCPFVLASSNLAFLSFFFLCIYSENPRKKHCIRHTWHIAFDNHSLKSEFNRLQWWAQLHFSLPIKFPLLIIYPSITTLDYSVITNTVYWYFIISTTNYFQIPI